MSLFNNNCSTIVIVGCGGLGSAIAYKLALYSYELNFNINSIKLIDHDTLDQKNTPYLTIDQNHWMVGQNKSDVLKSIIAPIIKSNVSVITDAEMFDHDAYVGSESEFVIDCRDCNCESTKTHLKLNIDGAYGIINMKPSTLVGKHGGYRLYQSKFYTDVMTSLVIRILFNEGFRLKQDSNKYIVNLKIGDELNVLNTDEESTVKNNELQ